MANDITNNPMILDTVDHKLIPKFLPVAVKRIVWQSPVSAGDTFTLKDQTGAIIATGKAEANGQSQVFLVEHTFDGADMFAIDSGTLYVYRN